MGGVEDQVARQPQYEAFADEFLDHAEHSLFNAYYDRPACLDLLGDVTGKRVLDAACGPGLYAAELRRRGASVVGFDHSPRMIEICRERAGPATSVYTTLVTQSFRRSRVCRAEPGIMWPTAVCRLAAGTGMVTGEQDGASRAVGCRD